MAGCPVPLPGRSVDAAAEALSCSAGHVRIAVEPGRRSLAVLRTGGVRACSARAAVRGYRR
ncbi:hypothetical protein GCM10027440_36350 [Nocardiopsis coralliicola]